MVALKTGDIDRFVARPDPARAVVLVFGPDAGLVSERVDAIVKASVDDTNDPFALVRLDGDTLASDPARLIDEATTVPLFGGRRAIRVRAGSRNIVPAVEARARRAPERLPRRDRGRRSQARRGAAQCVRARQERGRDPLLRRRGARPRAADRRGAARREPDDRARCARRAGAAARRRPPRLARRAAQARALCARPASASSSTT